MREAWQKGWSLPARSIRRIGCRGSARPRTGRRPALPTTSRLRSRRSRDERPSGDGSHSARLRVLSGRENLRRRSCETASPSAAGAVGRKSTCRGARSQGGWPPGRFRQPADLQSVRRPHRWSSRHPCRRAAPCGEPWRRRPRSRRARGRYRPRQPPCTSAFGVWRRDRPGRPMVPETARRPTPR